MKTLAALKRRLAQPDTYLTMVRHDWFPNKEEGSIVMNVKRKVVHVNTNSVVLENPTDWTKSSLFFESAKDVIFFKNIDNAFNVVLDPDNPSLQMGYLIQGGD